MKVNVCNDEVEFSWETVKRIIYMNNFCKNNKSMHCIFCIEGENIHKECNQRDLGIFKV